MFRLSVHSLTEKKLSQQKSHSIFESEKKIFFQKEEEEKETKKERTPSPMQDQNVFFSFLLGLYLQQGA